MNYSSKKIYDLYKEIVNILEDNKELKEKDEELIVLVAKFLLKNLYYLCEELAFNDILIEIDNIKKVLKGTSVHWNKDILIECLIKCKKLLEVNLTEKKSIVIYSGNAKKLQSLITALKVEGLDIFVHESEENFINLISFKAPKVIIIDNNSSDNNGLTLFKFILEDGSINKIPVIFTGDDNKISRVKALLLGAVDYIEKPFEDIDVIVKVKNIIQIANKNKCCDIGVFSRRYGKEAAIREFKKAKDNRRNFTVLIADIDNMAQLNLNLGMLVGDTIIKDIADVLRKYLDIEDFVYRKAGDKFVIVFPGKNGPQVFSITKSMSLHMTQLSKKYGIKISFSGGIASLSHETPEFDDVFNHAEECLSKAKARGKDGIYIYTMTENSEIKKRLLFIDSDRVILGILSSRYNSKGYEAFKAHNLENAFKILKSNKMNVIITELFMPGTTGTELLKGLSKMKEDSKIIVLSSLNTENAISISFNSGADDFISKPFSPVELDLRIRRFLE
jgi:two-component system, cell cycle response regulator